MSSPEAAAAQLKLGGALPDTVPDSAAASPGAASTGAASTQAPSLEEAPPAPELPDRQRSWEETPKKETPKKDESQVVPAAQAHPKLEGDPANATPVEAFNWQQLQAVSKRDSYCNSCRMPVEADPKSVVRKKWPSDLAV